MLEVADDLATQNDEPQDLRTALSEAFDRAEAEPEQTAAERARDEAGRFAKVEKAEKAAPVEKAGQPSEPVESIKPAAITPPVDAPAPVEAKRAPSSWRPAAAAEFDKLPPHVQDEVLRRETDFHKGVEGYKQHAELGRTFERVIAPYAQLLQQNQMTPDVAVAHLLEAEAKLRTGTPEQKATYFAQLARDYGIDLGVAQQMPIPDPYTSQLEQRLNLLQRQQNDWLEAQRREQTDKLNSEIQAFASDPSRSHFEAVRDDMAALIQTGRANDLATAYDMAVYANPKTRAALLEQQRLVAVKQTQSQAQAQRAKSAAVSVKGSSPASGSGTPKTSLRATLAAAFDGTT